MRDNCVVIFQGNKKQGKPLAVQVAQKVSTINHRKTFFFSTQCRLKWEV